MAKQVLFAISGLKLFRMQNKQNGCFDNNCPITIITKSSVISFLLWFSLSSSRAHLPDMAVCFFSPSVGRRKMGLSSAGENLVRSKPANRPARLPSSFQPWSGARRNNAKQWLAWGSKIIADVYFIRLLLLFVGG